MALLLFVLFLVIAIVICGVTCDEELTIIPGLICIGFFGVNGNKRIQSS